MVGPMDHWHLDGGDLALPLTGARRDVGEEVFAAARAVRQRSVVNVVEVLAGFAGEGELLLSRQLVAAEIRLEIALQSCHKERKVRVKQTFTCICIRDEVL